MLSLGFPLLIAGCACCSLQARLTASFAAAHARHMATVTGTVKWFNVTKVSRLMCELSGLVASIVIPPLPLSLLQGYGFISPNDGSGPDGMSIFICLLDVVAWR